MKKQIVKNKFLMVLFLSASFILGAGLVRIAANGSSNSGVLDTAKQIQNLLEKLQIASQNELMTGQTVETPQGKIFMGESAEKMKNLHDEILKQTDALIARSESARRLAIAEIKKFAKNENISVNYEFTGKSSYNADIPVEIYTVDLDQYEVDARNNKIIQFGPRPRSMGEKPKVIDETPRYTVKELEGIARKFISENAPDINLEKLAQKNTNKDGINYFFRWEDTSRKVEGMYPFIQVGFSKGGSLLSYTNSIGF